jgi:hypothetical protein
MVAAASACGSVFPHACPAACIESSSATFDFSCAPNDLVSATVSPGCDDSGNALGRIPFFSVFRSSPGTCHVVFTFASGFVYTQDVTFTSMTEDTGDCPPCPSYIGAVGSPFQVNNPASTCVDAGPPDAAAPDAPGASDASDGG